MDNVALVIGYIVLALLVGIAVKLAFEITGNVYGGIKGSYRLNEICVRNGKKSSGHWQIIKFGLKKWAGGNRYNGDVGVYYQLGDMQVPVDGRDKIVRRYRG